jgi:uncharacterized membrane protein
MMTLMTSPPASQATPDVFSQPSPPAAQEQVNVGGGERTISVAAGSILALLGLGRGGMPGLLIAAVGGGLIYRGASGHCPLYKALDMDTARDEATPEDYFTHGIHVEQSYLINKSPQELYGQWRNFENLPKIMTHLESVSVIDEKRSHWVAKAPSIAGGKVEWDAEIINDEPNALIAWRSLSGADVDNAGSVRFVDRGDRGTEVHVIIDYIPPAGRLGKWVARLFGEEPQQQIKEDLRTFKRVMETGEVPTIEGQPRGTCGGNGKRE